MTFKVVNTIQLPGVDFGGHLLQGMDAVFEEKPGRTEEEIVAAAADADAVICSGPVQPWTSRVIEALKQCRSHGARPVAIGVIVDRSSGKTTFDVPHHSLAELSFPTYKADELPPELASIEAIKPGS